VQLSPTCDEYDTIQEPTFCEAAYHFVSMPWKLLFAVVPPPIYGEGWLTFLIAFFLIGILSFFVQEVASTLGCLLNLSDSSMALTLLSAGCSLPDCIIGYQASKRSADASLTSIYYANSAALFIGLGFPWLIASGY
jgi:hypothetical protein